MEAAANTVTFACAERENAKQAAAKPAAIFEYLNIVKTPFWLVNKLYIAKIIQRKWRNERRITYYLKNKIWPNLSEVGLNILILLEI